MNLNFNEIKKILIIRLSSLGDILLSTPLIRTLKKINPKLQLDFVLRREYEELIKLNPYINKIYSYTNHKFEKQILFNSVLDEEYDLTIDLQNNFRSRELVRLLKCDKLKFNKNNFKKFLLVRFKINKLEGALPIPIRYINLIDNIPIDKEGLDFFTDEMVNPNLKNGAEHIGLCPGAKHFSKKWPGYWKP